MIKMVVLLAMISACAVSTVGEVGHRVDGDPCDPAYQGEPPPVGVCPAYDSTVRAASRYVDVSQVSVQCVTESVTWCSVRVDTPSGAVEIRCIDTHDGNEPACSITIEPPTTTRQAPPQGVVEDCDPAVDPHCDEPNGGTGGGGGAGGGGGSGGPSCRTANGSCDPSLGYSSDIACMQSCASFSARCYPTYRCGLDPGCPEAHVGYCAVY